MNREQLMNFLMEEGLTRIEALRIADLLRYSEHVVSVQVCSMPAWLIIRDGEDYKAEKVP